MLALAFGPGLMQALLAAFLFMLPAVFIGLMVGGLADARREAWDVAPRAGAMKADYRRVATWGLWGVRLGVALFLVQLVALLALRGADCVTDASHLGAAAWNLVFIADRAFFGLMVALVVLAVAGLVWGAVYFVTARREGWSDPRRKDAVVVHLLIVPMALLLMWVAYGVAPRMVCPALG